MSGLDGMRFLGADPAGRADEVEMLLMLKLQNRIVREQERAK